MDDTEHLHLQVVSNGADEIFVGMKHTTLLRKAMEVFCERQFMDPQHHILLFDGRRVGYMDTPAVLGMCDGDTVEAHANTIGMRTTSETSSDDSMEVDEPTPFFDHHSMSQSVMENGDYLDIKVITNDGDEVYFKIRPHSLMQKLMYAFCKRQGLILEHCDFLFDGDLVEFTDTPFTLGLSNGDVLEAYPYYLESCATSETSDESSMEVDSEVTTEDVRYVTIKVASEHDGELWFKLRENTQIKKVTEAFCDRVGLVMDHCIFWFDGAPLPQANTPVSLGMREGDVIEVHSYRQASAHAQVGEDDWVIVAKGDVEVLTERFATVI